MKFSDYIQKQADEFRRAGDGYDALSDTSKACIDYAVQRFVDEYAKQQAIAFAQHMFKNVWKMNGMGASPYVSEDQYYNQFIEQQNKQQ